MQSRIANRIRNWISREDIRDSACSLKLYRRQCLEGLQLYKGMHRFMPTLVKILPASTVREEPVKHSPRHAGHRQVRPAQPRSRALVDLLAVRWMKERYIRYEVAEIREGEAPARAAFSRVPVKPRLGRSLALPIEFAIAWS